MAATERVPEFRGKIYDSILETIGATPLVRLRRLAAEAGCKADIARQTASSSTRSGVKDRIGVAMIEAAEREGKIKPGHGHRSSRPAATPASRWPSSAPPRATS